MQIKIGLPPHTGWEAASKKIACAGEDAETWKPFSSVEGDGLGRAIMERGVEIPSKAETRLAT